MPIRCVCSNGHMLKVKECLAGGLGLCPICKVRVRVPQLPDRNLSEDAILDILGPQTQVAVSKPHAAVYDTADYSEPLITPSQSGIHERGTPKKSCSKCNEEISSGTHICPFCHTYIAQLGDF